MGFQTPQYKLADYLKWTASGRIQLPDFQRGYKWDDERIRQLLVTILRGHPLGVVMLLQTGNDQVRFKPKPLAGTEATAEGDPDMLLLDGQQRLTSLTQALTGDGVVATMDARGKLIDRRYYINIGTALRGEDRIDDAVISVPGDGMIRENFGRDVVLDLSDPDKERRGGFFPARLLYDPLNAATWLAELDDRTLMPRFMAEVLQPAGSYAIPAIELDRATGKAAVATVFEKVNTGGLPLTVFELLTATFAGDKDYYDRFGTDFRLNDDWHETQQKLSGHPVLAGLENTDFLQAVTMLATLKRNKADTSGRPPAVSAKREDVLKLALTDYLEWVGPLREAFIWVADFLADRHIFDLASLPYQKQLVPLATLRVVMETDADLIGPRERLVRWFWCGILGELYGGSTDTRLVRDLEQVPAWAASAEGGELPSTIADATFVESRLHSLRTRNAAAYKGIYALLLGNQARDWMQDKALDMAQYVNLAVDIHHVFPQQWCKIHGIDPERRESIVNKTPISARTNRVIGGVAPSKYTSVIEKKAQIPPERLDALVEAHLVPAGLLRADDFDAYFIQRRERLCKLVEQAMGKAVPRDLDEGDAQESSAQFEPELIAESTEEED